VTDNINYSWAKDFNRGGLKRHFIDHWKEFDAKTTQEYAAKAVHFANEVDRKNYKSVVDYKGTTYKFDPRNGRMIEVTKDGYVISYRHIGGKFWYYSKKGEKSWIKI
jgi:pyocin large subunit-like protein